MTWVPLIITSRARKDYKSKQGSLEDKAENSYIEQGNEEMDKDAGDLARSGLPPLIGEHACCPMSVLA